MIEGIDSAVRAFAGAASSGHVSVDTDAARDVLNKIVTVGGKLAELLDHAGFADTEVRLGANPVGEAMSRKSMSRYRGGDSFLAVVSRLGEQTEQAERALRQSIDNYAHTDSGHAARYRDHEG
jgi:hypothetical protein